jgi:murein DD-endopeptidase MepM/ murein hydrolase activator NlpD
VTDVNRWTARLAGTLALTGLAACLATGAVTGPGAPPARADAATDLRATAAALESSSAEVQAAGLALARTATALPGAQREVNVARGELAGAEAVLAAAQREVRAGELLLRVASKRVDAATARLQETRDQLGRLARRSYQLGPLQEIRTITESGPEQFLERTALLQQAFRGGDDALNRLTVDRFALAQQRAQLDAAQQQLDAARDTAAQGEARARQLADRAQQAADRVAALVTERARALLTAKRARAQDLRDYRAAQAASRELARRLREAAARDAHRGVARVGQMLWPADGPLTSRYGYRTHPIYGDRRFHAGIDIGAGYGSSVVAADGGTVVYAGSANGYGTLVLISHGTRNGKDLATGYAHMSALLVTEGQRVGRGQQVGRVGNEGNSTGPHLHFEVRLDGEPVDPLDYVSPP